MCSECQPAITGVCVSVCVCVCVCGDSVVRGVWDQAARLLYLDVLVGEPVKSCARSTGLQALGIFCVRASFDLVSSSSVLPGVCFRWVPHHPAVVERRAAGGKRPHLVSCCLVYSCLPGSLLLFTQSEFPRPSAVRDRGAWGQPSHPTWISSLVCEIRDHIQLPHSGLHLSSAWVCSQMPPWPLSTPEACRPQIQAVCQSRVCSSSLGAWLCPLPQDRLWDLGLGCS